MLTIDNPAIVGIFGFENKQRQFLKVIVNLSGLLGQKIFLAASLLR